MAEDEEPGFRAAVTSRLILVGVKGGGAAASDSRQSKVLPVAAAPTPAPGAIGTIKPVAPWPPRPIETPRSPPGPIDAPWTPGSIETPIIRTPETAPRPTDPTHLLHLRGRAASQPMIQRRHGRSFSSTEDHYARQQRARHSRTKLISRVHCLSSLLNDRRHFKLIKSHSSQ
jgi:hypothetical protein